MIKFLKNQTTMDEVMSPCHVLVFPAPAQGHISSMLKLAELLCGGGGGFHVTFLTPTYIHRRLSQHSDVTSRFSRRSFRLLPIPDGLQNDVRPGSFDVKEWLDSLRETAQPFLRDLLASNHDKDDSSPIHCVISDGILGFVLEIAEEMSVPVFYMRTLSACAFWAYFSLPDLIKSHELPFDSKLVYMTTSSVFICLLLLRL